jgi:hypothetical protein
VSEKNSSLKIFSIIKNINKFVNNEKDVPDFFKIQSQLWFNRSSDHLKNHCKRIYSDLESNLYKQKDLALYILYTYIFDYKLDYSKITEKNINKVKNLFTKQRIEKDQKFILELSEKTKLSELSDYFKLNSSGSNIMYDLVIKEYISPIFYIDYEDCVSEIDYTKANDYLQNFKKIITKLKQILLK